VVPGVVRNLLSNPSLDEGAESPAAWEWVVISGRPVWVFDFEEKFGGVRSVKVLQDVGKVHGEFSQTVPCRPSARYRLRARVRTAVEGTGDESGANLSLRSLKGGIEIHRLGLRPFFVGRADWTLWTTDYVTPDGADALAVSFDMRNSSGVAWFDALELFEAPEPLASSVDPPEIPASVAAFPRARSVRILFDEEPRFFVNEVLAPLVGRGFLAKGPAVASASQIAEDAVIFWDAKSASDVGFDGIARLAKGKVVILAPEALEGAVGRGGIKAVKIEDALVAPCARIEKESFLTAGLRKGDVIPWWSDPADTGRFYQTQIAAEPSFLVGLGFEVVAASRCADAAADGRPVVLCRPAESGGGIFVMDLEPLNSRPRYTADANLVCLILSNALGRRQISLGAYVVPAFDYDRFSKSLRALAEKHPGLDLSEEGRTAEDRPIYSVSVGPADAPVFFVDAGIHPYEWAPCFGSILYAARIADEYARGLPWARALLKSLRLKCLPVYAPDGWESAARGVRGVNLNRNFPLYWDEYKGADKGPAPLSEPETRTVARILQRDNVIAGVSWHETSANTNWVGMPGFTGRYARYARAVPAMFRQFIDGSHFYWQASTWTQVTDPRNFQYHYMDSYPYLRDYSASREPYEVHYGHSLGIDSFLVEQYGNSEMYYSATPQRTDMTGRILEMLFGLEVGLVCRNHGSNAVEASIPLVANGAAGDAVIYSNDGAVLERRALRQDGDVRVVEGTLPPGACLVVEFDPPPWLSRPKPGP